MSTTRATKVTTEAESVGQRLCRLRKERGITQVELAQRLGLVQGLVSDYERGKLRIHADLLIRLAQVLEVSGDELLGLTPTPKSEASPQARRVKRRFDALQKLPKRDQETVLRTIDAFLKAS